jgi:acyl-CoA synthetase (AMP-forming)/AMP-acid ligase II
LIVGGDVVDPKSAKAVLESKAPKKLLNGYGPTESTTFACTYQIERVTDEVKSFPIGKPIANTETYILDRHRNPVPVGVIGELYIGGPGLARGYLNAPELTAEKFVVHPFSDDSQARLYKTGDLARYLPDGNIEFLGRIDNQVKIRGFRIELGEVETALARHPSLSESVVMAHGQVASERSIVAYVVPINGQDVTSTELRAFLSAELPDYMVPTAFIIMNAFPLTSNGKVDRVCSADFRTGGTAYDAMGGAAGSLSDRNR